MMTRRRFLFLVCGGVAAAAIESRAQTQGKIPRIGYLVLQPLVEPPTAERAAFLQGLRELGYVEGRNIHIEYRSAEGEVEFLPALATELVQKNVDVIVATSTEPVKAAMQVTRTIPIVMTSVGNPVANGLIKSLAHPGGNVTGLSLLADELAGKRLQLLREVLPRARRVAVLRNVQNRVVQLEWKSTQTAAANFGLTLLPFELGHPDAVSRMLTSVAKTRPDALLLLIDPRVVSYSGIIIEFATRNRIPSFAGWSNFAELGGVLSYSPSLPALFQRAAKYVDKILKGAKPGELPVELPTRFELVLNLKTAKTLGITIPNSILLRADKVIE